MHTFIAACVYMKRNIYYIYLSRHVGDSDDTDGYATPEQSPRRKSHPRSKPKGRLKRQHIRERWQIIRKKIPQAVAAVNEKVTNMEKEDQTKFFAMVRTCSHAICPHG